MHISLDVVITCRYGDETIKILRKLEKVDHSLQKAELDLEFLITCRDINMTLIFFQLFLS